MSSRIRYLALAKMDWLHESVDDNLDRYLTGTFSDLTQDGGWGAELSLTMDDTALCDLTPEMGMEAEVHNSITVGTALSNLPPSIATEGRLWTRLAHLDCLEYCRGRWLTGVPPEKLVAAVRKHFFAFSLTQYRDDHAVSRLWWNYHIASFLKPEDPVKALQFILKTADIRSNIIERTWISTRRNLARAILRRMFDDSWVTAAELNFREFMKAINRRGAGSVFEVMTDEEVDEVLMGARTDAKAVVDRSS